MGKGVQEFRSSGVVESWSRGVVESWSRGVVESWSRGVVDTGWKPMLHCFQDSRAISQSHPESYFRGPGMTGDGVIVA
jgi:hypothetical protein